MSQGLPPLKNTIPLLRPDVELVLLWQMGSTRPLTQAEKIQWLREAQQHPNIDQENIRAQLRRLGCGV